MISAFLAILALVLFLVAAFVASAEPSRGKLTCIGLACLTAAELLRGIGPALR